MDIGIALPTMAPGYGPTTTVDWARGIDAGPFSSVSTGERISFDNQDWTVALATAAAVTGRVRVIANVVVLPLHPAAEVAKQAVALDQVSNGRFTLGVGVGGREHDYRSLGAPFSRRHAHLDEQVAELRRLWAGEPPFDGADPIGPPPVQAGGPPLLAGSLGPKSMARAARWDGLVIQGSTALGLGGEVTADHLREAVAWTSVRRTAEGRTGPYEVIAQGVTPADPEAARAIVEPWADAGATWWVEADWTNGSVEATRARILAGPPKPSGMPSR